MKFNEAYNAESFEGYLETITPEFTEGLMLESLFPTKKRDGLEFDYLVGGNGPIELTSPSQWDAEPVSQHRKDFDVTSKELPLWRKKMNMSEKEKAQLKLYIQANDEPAIARLLGQIYDDQSALLKGGLMTHELLRARVLMDGGINIASKGGSVMMDYGVPSDQKVVLSGAGTVWSDPDAKILDDITSWIELVESKSGVKLEKMYMNANTFKYLKKNKQIKELATITNALYSQTVPLTNDRMKQIVLEYTDLTEIVVYNRKVQLDGKLIDLIEDDKVALVPAGALGNTWVGTSPAEMNMAEANKSGADIRVMGNGMAINTYTNTKAPYTSGTEIEYVAAPSFEMSNNVFLATVHS